MKWTVHVTRIGEIKKFFFFEILKEEYSEDQDVNGMMILSQSKGNKELGVCGVDWIHMA
jgi:hypothetical protein